MVPVRARPYRTQKQRTLEIHVTGRNNGLLDTMAMRHTNTVCVIESHVSQGVKIRPTTPTIPMPIFMLMHYARVMKLDIGTITNVKI